MCCTQHPSCIEKSATTKYAGRWCRRGSGEAYLPSNLTLVGILPTDHLGAHPHCVQTTFATESWVRLVIYLAKYVWTRPYVEKLLPSAIVSTSARRRRWPRRGTTPASPTSKAWVCQRHIGYQLEIRNRHYDRKLWQLNKRVPAENSRTALLPVSPSCCQCWDNLKVLLFYAAPCEWIALSRLFCLLM